MVQLQNISKSFGGRVLFSQGNLHIGPQDRCAIVGRNGSGKSTLLRMILGEESVDEGELVIPQRKSIGTLPQHIVFTESTVLEEAVLGLPIELRDSVYLVEKILMGLGITEEMFRVSPESLSGGYRLRLALCKVLVAEPDILLLDEPTNYLDIVTIRWLERFLSRWQGQVLFISHDKSFVNKVCTHIIGIHRKQLKKVEGNLEKYYELLALSKESHERAREKIEKKKAHMQSFVDRFRAKASKAAQARGRQKAIDKLESLDALVDEAEIDFDFKYLRFNGKKLLETKHLSFSYGAQGPLLINKLSLTVDPGDRLAVIGKNGRGKSTFLRLLTGHLRPSSGELIAAEKLVTGYFGQDSIEKLQLEHSLEEELSNACPKATYEEIRSACGVMLFDNDDMKKKIRVLSGGERSRVVLAKILLSETNFLILDEPTHHLDVESIDALLRAIKNFSGTVILVSHEESVLNDFEANKILIFESKRQRPFLGSYQDFLDRVGWEEERGEKPQESNKSGSAKESFAQSKQLQALEREINKWEVKRSESELQIAHLYATGADNDELPKQNRSLERANTKLAELYDQLENLID